MGGTPQVKEMMIRNPDTFPRSGSPRLPELLLPAGGFDSAIAAFEGGADAVYLGLGDFSARRQARNFDELEYRRVLRLAHEGGHRIYVAMNTVVTGGELEKAAETLVFLSRFTPDALIFQDWGIARLAAESFPEIPLHASTQTAIQTDEAVRLARETGARRIVLPRETTILELSERAAAEPDMEFEVFVHGALCYSFSGICLASGLELGRSGNRGECAQLCRSWYSGAGGTGGGAPGGSALRGEGYWFSGRDLSLVDRLGDLVAAGAASFKVEGRMKSPEYVHAVAALYRGALDRLAGSGPDDAVMAGLKEAARVAFSRGTTSGWAAHHGGQAIVDAAFPGHRGARLGRVVASGDDSLTLELESGLALRDGVQAVGSPPPGTLAPSVQLSVQDMRDARNGGRIFEAAPGMRVTIPAEGIGAEARALLTPGSPIEKISSRALDRRKASPEEFPPAIQELDARLRLDGGGEGCAVGILELDYPGVSDVAPVAGSMPAGSFDLRVSEGFRVEQARRPDGFYRALDVFSESADFDFRIRLPNGPGAARTGAGYEGPAVADLFVPPSALKRFKNEAYRCVAELIGAVGAERAKRAVDRATTAPGDYAAPNLPRPDRAAIVFADPRIEGGMPYATPALLDAARPLPEIAGWRWLPLAPLAASTGSYMRSASERILAELDSGGRVAVGLDAVHHVAFARALSASAGAAGRVDRLAFWLDIHLYAANPATLAYFASKLEGIAFAYAWIEADRAGLAESAARFMDRSPIPVAQVGRGFNAPLFLSKACLIRHHLGDGHCPVPCGKRMTAPLRDRDRGYTALVEDCVTMLFRKSSS